MGDYYDGTKLLSMKDKRGLPPEIFMCTTNRTGGKTTFFNRLLVNGYLKKAKKFGLLYRFKYELADIPDKFFKDINSLFFNGMDFDAKIRAEGAFAELYLNGEDCGYALSLNSADKIKTYSHLFSDVDHMLFDEFQSETNHYCPEEIRKFISVHTSVARGQGKQVRYVPVYMLANTVTMLNPYYYEFGVSSRLSDKTKFLKGDGYVLEQGYVETAAKAQMESGFNRAFARNRYVSYSSQAVYLNDSTAFIDHLEGKNQYICTLKYMRQNYGIHEYSDKGVLYCDRKADLSYPLKVVVTTEDHEINYVMLKRNDMLISNLRYLFERGCFRFKDLQCKDAVLGALSYH